MERKMIRFDVQDTWSARELSEFIGSVDFVYTTLALAELGSSKARFFRLPPDARKKIGPENAYLLLETDYRLVIKEISIASPGFISFEGVDKVIEQLRAVVKDITGIRRGIRRGEIRHQEDERDKKK
jgi:hypothetical protein